MAHEPQIRTALGILFAATAILTLSGAALAQGAAAAPTAPGATIVGTSERPTNSQVMPGGALLLVPGRRLTVDLQQNAPILAGEVRAPADPILAANPNATPSQWQTAASSELPKEQGTVIFTVYSDPARGTKMVVANGMTSPVIFAVTLLVTMNGTSRALNTTTCATPPGGASVEYWANVQVDAVLVPRVAISPSPVCFDSAADRFYAPGTIPPSQAAAAPAPAPNP